MTDKYTGRTPDQVERDNDRLVTAKGRVSRIVFPTLADLVAARQLIGMDVDFAGDRTWDPGTSRWYKNGYAPWQLADTLTMDCGGCGGRGTLVVTKDQTPWCSNCNPTIYSK